MMPGNYVADVLSGEAMLDDIDAYVAFWHENDIQQPLQVFLGFTDDEYDTWMKEGNGIVRDILFCRRNRLDFMQYGNDKSHLEHPGELEVLKKYRATA